MSITVAIQALRSVVGALMVCSIILFGISGCSSVYELTYEGDDFPVYKAVSVKQQNARVIEELSEKGFETEEVDRGVIVYLPPNIYFDGSQANISLLAREKIAEISGELNKKYLLVRKVEVAGHTDTTGEPELNLELSKKRAQAASEELLFSKVDKSRISTSWFGETQPRFADFNDDGSPNVEGRAKNRRVEFIILNPK